MAEEKEHWLRPGPAAPVLFFLLSRPRSPPRRERRKSEQLAAEDSRALEGFLGETLRWFYMGQCGKQTCFPRPPVMIDRHPAQGVGKDVHYIGAPERSAIHW